jgi:hypothetical protein
MLNPLLHHVTKRLWRVNGNFNIQNGKSEMKYPFFLRYDAPSQGNPFAAFRGKVMVSSSRVEMSKNYGWNQCIPNSWHYPNSKTLPTYVWQWLKKRMVVRRSCWYPCWATPLHHVETPLHFEQTVQLRVWTQMLVSQQLAEGSGQMQLFSPCCWDSPCSISATYAHLQHIYQELCHLCLKLWCRKFLLNFSTPCI